MDFFGIQNIPSWSIVFIVTFYMCYLYFSHKYKALESLGLPGPKPLPLIGNSLQDLFYVTHEKDIENIKKYGRVYCFYEGTRLTLRVSDPDILKEIFVKQFNNFTDRRHIGLESFDPILGKMLSVLEGNDWKTARNVMSPTFTSGKLKHMIPLFDKIIQKLVDTMAKKADTGESLDARNIYFLYLLEAIGVCVFGVEMNADDKHNDVSFIDYAKRLIFPRPIINFYLLMLLPRKLSAALNIRVFDVDAFNYVKNMLRSVIKARESENDKRADFLQIMLDAAKNANTKLPRGEREQLEDKEKQDIKTILTPDGIVAQSVVFLMGGFGTTTTTLSYLSYLAATNPKCQDKLIEEVDRILAKNEGRINWETIAQMTYMDMFIAETLRKYPPGLRLDRQCMKETQIGELRIPKGTIIYIPAYAIHHDEEFYPDPEKFDPERFTPENKEQRNPYTYLVFGAGPRNCIGMRFALMEVKLTFIHMLKHFRFCRSPKTQEPLTFQRGHTQLKPTQALHVILAKR